MRPSKSLLRSSMDLERFLAVVQAVFMYVPNTSSCISVSISRMRSLSIKDTYGSGALLILQELIMKKILFAVAMLMGISGCSWKAQISDLETKVAGLDQDKHDTCAAVIEVMGGGIFVYIGDDTYLNRVTGVEMDYPDLVEDCDQFLIGFREAVAERQKSREGQSESTDQPSE